MSAIYARFFTLAVCPALQCSGVNAQLTADSLISSSRPIPIGKALHMLAKLLKGSPDKK